MRVLVTGATGFAGGFLLQHLRGREEGDTLFALARAGSTVPKEDVGVRWLVADLCDPEATAAMMAEAQPDAIYHLAGQASGAADAHDLVYAHNVDATLQLLAAAARLDRPVRVMLASTGYVYGACVLGRPATEESPLQPQGVYAQSKAEMERRALAEPWGGRVSIVIARAFNHTGPRQTPAFVVPSFARQLAEIEAGRAAPVLRVGNLESWRDLCDVRDVTRAYRAVMEVGATGECFNVCSGKAVQIREVLQELVSLCRVGVAVEQDPELVRPVDVAVNYGSPRKLESRTGWRPAIPLAQTLSDTLDWWRRNRNLP